MNSPILLENKFNNLLCRMFISNAKEDHDIMFKGFMLKVHAMLCVLMTSYSIFRIVFDPKIMEARK